MSYVDPSASQYAYLNTGGPAPPGATIQATPAQAAATDQAAQQQGAAQVQKGADTKKADTAKAAAQKVEATKQQINDLLSGLTYAEASGPQAAATAQKIATLLQTLPMGDATQFLNSPALKGTALGTAVTNAAATGGTPAAATPAAPYYDPLALQTMWHDVFGPAYAQASKIAGSTGGGYQQAMNQAIAGGHQTPQAAQQLQGQAGATANLLQQFGQTSAQAVPAGLSFDSLIAALGQAGAKARLAQGAYERQATLGSYPTSLTGGTTPVAALNQAIGGGAATAGTNPLAPNINVP